MTTPRAGPDPLAAASLLAVLLLVPATAAAQTRCALSVLHYNIQYCAGGLEGMAEELGLDPQGYDWSEDALEDAIIVESFEPVLGLLEGHPDWTLTLEMQGLMIEVMAERHPDVLARLRTLAHAGQAELVSFHYSDQLFLAYPGEDTERSIERTRAVFAEHDLPLSGAVFTQEGQFGEGMLPLMDEHGYSVAVIPRNLFKLSHDDLGDQALFDSGVGAVHAVVGGRGWTDPDTGAGFTWTFVNDGELVATGEMTCYLGPLFVYQEWSLLQYEQELQERADEGYRISGIDACVTDLLAEGVTPEPLPPILDGTWQPGDTDNFGLWMGGGGLFAGDDGSEDDNGVLTRGIHAGKVLRATQARAADLDDQHGTLDEAWRRLALGQVSDATGWNPYRTETEYAHEHLERAENGASGLVTHQLYPEHADTTIWLDADGMLIDMPADADGPDAFGAAYVIDGGPRGVDEQLWTSGITGLPVLEVTFGAEDDGAAGPSVTFDWDGVAFRGVTALSEDVFEVPVDEITSTAVGLPAALGVVGLAPDVWIVLEQETVHLAALHDRGPGTVTFRDETLRGDEGATWRFHLATTAADAVAAGVLLNQAGPVRVELSSVGDDDDTADPAPGDDDADDCSCDAGRRPAGGVLAGMALAAAVLTLRRRG